MSHVDAALQGAKAVGVDRLDAQLLLAAVTGRPRSWLLAHGEAELAAPDAARYAQLLARRADGEPLAYLLGEREFHGLKLHITPAVLDPRPDTETLVDWALELLADDLAALAQPVVADLGTGSGAIALAVAQACPLAQVWASDASSEALAVAQGNGQRLGLPVQWLAGDWWAAYDAAQAPRLHLALSNPPYIAGGDPHLPALRHEPWSALVPPGGDALASLRQIIQGAAPRLAAGGWLLLEHGHDQSPAVAELLREAGFEAVAYRLDLAGHRRCTGGRKPCM